MKMFWILFFAAMVHTGSVCAQINPVPFIPKTELPKRVDRRIESITGNDGIASYRFMFHQLGYGRMIDRYQEKYDRYLNQGYRAMSEVNPFLPLSFYYYNYRPSMDYCVDILLEPLQNRRQLNQTLFETPLNPAQIRVPPLVLPEAPPSDLENQDEYDEALEILPKAPSVTEPPARPAMDASSPGMLQPPETNNPEPADAPDELESPLAALSFIALQEAGEPKPRSPLQLLYDEGLLSYAHRNYPKARKTFEKIVALAPDSPHTLFIQGLTLFYSGDYHKSLQAIQRSYAIADAQGAPYAALWQIPINAGDFQYHYKKLARRVERSPDDQDASALLFLLTQAGLDLF
ncbi:MAG: hypothetical protein JXR73_23295 [Candidatus Omnitrophica bacterium]|nr:hypothetical protein [Candidatus Omnitrophota bacterium]